MDRAEHAARNLSNGAEESSRSLKDIARGFAGLGIGMSMRFARQFVEPGSGTDKALAIGEGAANYGVMGAKMGGGPGAVVGTIVGLGKGYMETEKAELDQVVALGEQKVANLDAIKSWQQARKETLEFKATLDQLTDSETSLADRQRMVAEEIKKREEAEKELSAAAFRAGTSIDNSTPEKLAKSQDAAAKAIAKYQEYAAKTDQLRAVRDRLAKEKPSSGSGADWNGVDALSSVGGMFAGSGAGARAIEDIAASTAETVKVLKEIERSTDGGGGATWQ